MTRRFLLTLAGTIAVCGCRARSQRAAAANATPRLATITLAISGMT